MRVWVLGIEGSQGVGKTSGKAYEIGQLHVSTPLAPPLSADGISKGAMGSTYRVGLDLVRKLVNLPLPFQADLAIQDVMRFGKRETMVLDLTPLQPAKGSAA